jgi:hypothetical protein
MKFLSLSSRVFFGVLFSSVLLMSCEDEITNPSVEEPVALSPGITMSLKTTGAVETEYIVSQDDVMSGSISAEGTGIEQEGWRYYYAVGKTLFSSGYIEDNRCIVYESNDMGELVQKSEFSFDNPLQLYGKSRDNETFFAMDNFYGGVQAKTLLLVDVEAGMIDKRVSISIFESEDLQVQAWATALIEQDGKFFIPFQIMDALGGYTTPDASKAYVAVYDYNSILNAAEGTTVNPEKIIVDTRTGNIGTNGHTTGLIQSETGDLYSYSCGAVIAGFAPASEAPSGILKINKGETEFDPNYFLNIEEATNGGKIFWFDYVGNNKAIARILSQDFNDPAYAWAAYSRSLFNQKLVLIDLGTGSITDIADVPYHAKRYSSPVLVDEGFAYVSVETETEAYVYKVDIANASAVKGAKIIGKTIKGFYKL